LQSQRCNANAAWKRCIGIAKHACPVEHLSNRRKHSLINQSQSFRPVVDFNAGGAIADHPTAPATAAEN
jgi:hypothetical protein